MLNTASMNKLATNASNLTDWLIGDSLLRNVDLDNLPRNTKVECLRGASISKAHSFITKNNLKANKLTVLVGTNNCADKVSPEEIICDFRELIQSALQAAQTVIISSIPPVVNDCERQEIADQVNAALSVLCEETCVTFVSHDNNFRLADNSVNDLVLADDGIHLNVAGTTRLLKNLGFDNLKNSSKKNSKQNHSTNKRHTNDKTRNQPESKDKHNPVIRRSVQSNYAQLPLSNNKIQHPKENRDSHCWYCGETGHITDSCRHGYRITCQRCNTKGHKQKSCTVYI